MSRVAPIVLSLVACAEASEEIDGLGGLKVWHVALIAGGSLLLLAVCIYVCWSQMRATPELEDVVVEPSPAPKPAAPTPAAPTPAAPTPAAPTPAAPKPAAPKPAAPKPAAPKPAAPKPAAPKPADSKAGLAKALPSHWGKPPAGHTKDEAQLPDGYGRGSKDLADWIASNTQRDRRVKSLGWEKRPPLKWGPIPVIPESEKARRPGPSRFGYGSVHPFHEEWIESKVREYVRVPRLPSRSLPTKLATKSLTTRGEADMHERMNKKKGGRYATVQYGI